MLIARTSRMIENAKSYQNKTPPRCMFYTRDMQAASHRLTRSRLLDPRPLRRPRTNALLRLDTPLLALTKALPHLLEIGLGCSDGGDVGAGIAGLVVAADHALLGDQRLQPLVLHLQLLHLGLQRRRLLRHFLCRLLQRLLPLLLLDPEPRGRRRVAPPLVLLRYYARYFGGGGLWVC